MAAALSATSALRFLAPPLDHHCALAGICSSLPGPARRRRAAGFRRRARFMRMIDFMSQHFSVSPKCCRRSTRRNVGDDGISHLMTLLDRATPRGRRERGRIMPSGNFAEGHSPTRDILSHRAPPREAARELSRHYRHRGRDAGKVRECRKRRAYFSQPGRRRAISSDSRLLIGRQASLGGFAFNAASAARQVSSGFISRRSVAPAIWRRRHGPHRAPAISPAACRATMPISPRHADAGGLMGADDIRRSKGQPPALRARRN